MPGESISFDITASGDADRKFRAVGDAALVASGKVDVAAASLKAFNDASAKSSKATDNLVKSKLAAAKADKTLSDAESFVSGEADKLTRLLSGESRAFGDVAKKTDDAGKAAAGATSRFSALAGGGAGGAGVTGMGALVTVAAGLVPILFTVGTGLTGLGLAAYGIYKPISNAAQATGGLRANMSRLNPEQQNVARGILALGKTFGTFQQQLQPAVFTVFNQGLHLAGNLLHDVAPVASATGKALGGVLGQIDKQFQSGTWQQFFAFMAKTAGPDIQQIGTLFTNLMQVLPPLLEALQPIGQEFLTMGADAAKALVPVSNELKVFTGNVQGSTDNLTKGAHAADNWFTNLTNHIPGVHAINDWLTRVQKSLGYMGQSAQHSVAPLQHMGTQASTAAGLVQSLATAVTSLNAAATKSLNTQLTYSGELLTSANDAHLLRVALKASGDQVGLHTAAQRASFGAANTYITDLSKQAQGAIAAGKGEDGAISAIRSGLPILDAAKTKNRLYWQEVKTLHDWLVKLETLKAIRETVFVSGSGTFTVRPGTSLGLPGGTAGGPFAAGGQVPGSGNSDSYAAMLTPGEVVVPKRMVSAGAVDHLRGSLPGFAAGGLVPSYSGNVAGLVPWSRNDLNATVKIFESSIAKATLAGIRSAAASSSPGFGVRASGPLQTYAKRLLQAYGWSSQWPAFNDIVMRESGWNVYAQNPSSGAYGIPQALPGYKMASAGADWRTDGFTQLRWMMGYIRQRWGDPANADYNEVTQHWYDKGGWLKPGLTLAYNGTGRPEMVVPHGASQQQLVLEVNTGAGGELDQLFATWLRKYIRVRGGNVQLVLGRN